MTKSMYSKVEKVIYFCTMMMISFSIVCILGEYTIWNSKIGQNIAWALIVIMTLFLAINILYNYKFDNAVKKIMVGLIMVSVFLFGSLPAIIFMSVEVFVFFMCSDVNRKKEIIESSMILYISIIFEIVSVFVILYPNCIEKLNYKIFCPLIIDIILVFSVVIEIYKTKIAELCVNWTFIHRNTPKCCTNMLSDKFDLMFSGLLGIICGVIGICILMMKGQVYWEYSDWMLGDRRYLIFCINIILLIVQFVVWYLLSREFIKNCNKIINLYIAFILVFTPNIFISLFMFSSTMIIYTIFVLIMYLFVRLINNHILQVLIIGGICALQIAYSFKNKIYAFPIVNVLLLMSIILFIKKFYPLIKTRYVIQKNNALKILVIVASMELLVNFVVVKNYILDYEQNFYELNQLYEKVAGQVRGDFVFYDSDLKDNEIKYLNSRNIICEKKYTKDMGDNYAVIVNKNDIDSKMVNAYIVDTTNSYTCLVRNENLCESYDNLKYIQNLEPDKVDLSIVNEKWSKEGEFSVEVSVGKNPLVEYYNNGNVYLSYHVFDETHKMVIWDGIRSPMDEIIRGNEQEVAFDLSELEKGKKYYYEIDIIEEGVRWFSCEGMSVAKGEFELK